MTVDISQSINQPSINHFRVVCALRCLLIKQCRNRTSNPFRTGERRETKLRKRSFWKGQNPKDLSPLENTLEARRYRHKTVNSLIFSYCKAALFYSTSTENHAGKLSVFHQHIGVLFTGVPANCVVGALSPVNHKGLY